MASYNSKFSHSLNTGEKALAKVPEITALFWIIKLLTTAMGEATSDFLALHFGPISAVIIGAIALGIALALQIRSRRFEPWRYWLAVSMVAVFGTMAADGLHVEVGIPYIITTIFFVVVLAIVFVLWQKTEKTLSVHSIYTRRREAFYWLTVMSTFALGTAAGDLTATTFGLGYFSSALMFSGLILIPAIGYWLLNMNAIFAFWFAYVLTRPIGASYADWMGVAHSSGGLGLGRGVVSLGLSAIIIIFVIYLQITRKDTKARTSDP
jgi:uncharacterized membrane-anchored protein